MNTPQDPKAAETVQTTIVPAVDLPQLVLPWRAGFADNPQQNDKRFASYGDALEHARQQCHDLEVWAVWNEDDDVTVLIHLSSIWRK